MPVDDGSLNIFNISNDVIIEIIGLIQLCNDFKIFIGHDFNIDLTSVKYGSTKLCLLIF